MGRIGENDFFESAFGGQTVEGTGKAVTERHQPW